MQPRQYLAELLFACLPFAWELSSGLISLYMENGRVKTMVLQIKETVSSRAMAKDSVDFNKNCLQNIAILQNLLLVLKIKYKCITMEKSGGIAMSEPVLRITPKKYCGETTIVSMRIAKDLLKDIDAVANVTGRNRNEILTMSLEFALNNMEIVTKEREEK